MFSVTRDYKIQKMAVNVDWESVKTKYEDTPKLSFSDCLSSLQLIQQECFLHSC